MNHLMTQRLLLAVSKNFKFGAILDVGLDDVASFFNVSEVHRKVFVVGGKQRQFFVGFDAVVELDDVDYIIGDKELVQSCCLFLLCGFPHLCVGVTLKDVFVDTVLVPLLHDG